MDITEGIAGKSRALGKGNSLQFSLPIEYGVFGRVRDPARFVSIYALDKGTSIKPIEGAVHFQNYHFSVV